MKKALLIIIAAVMAVCAFGENQYDIIYTTDGKSIEAVIAEVSKTEVKYHEPLATDGPLFVISTDDIIAIHFSNGQVKTYKFGSAYKLPETTKTITTTTASTAKPSQNTGYITHDLARVKSYSGIYVFMNSTPASPYHILGDISISSIRRSDFLGYSVIEPVSALDMLISSAIRANRNVDGIITEDGYNATLIQFDSSSDIDKSLARVKSKKGYLVFVESSPESAYNYVCTKKIKILIEGQDITELLINKFSHTKGVDAIIVNLGGTADGISFK